VILLVGHQEEHQTRKKLRDDLLAWLCARSKAQVICIWSNWCQCHPIISCFIKVQIGLTWHLTCIVAMQVFLKKEAIERVSVIMYQWQKTGKYQEYIKPLPETLILLHFTMLLDNFAITMIQTTPTVVLVKATTGCTDSSLPKSGPRVSRILSCRSLSLQ